VYPYAEVPVCESPNCIHNADRGADTDDIRFIDGYPAKFICLARRKAKDWFIAAINADTKRNLSIPLDFLKPGSYSVKLYTDSNTGDITAKDFILDSARPLRITLAPNAGFATKIPNSFE